MIFRYIIRILLLFSIVVHAQERLNSRQLFMHAEYFMLFNDYQKAISIYLPILKKDPLNPNLNCLIGLCYLNDFEKRDSSLNFLNIALKPVLEQNKSKLWKKLPDNVFWYSCQNTNTENNIIQKKERNSLPQYPKGFLKQLNNLEENVAISGDERKLVYMIHDNSLHTIFYTTKKDSTWSDPVIINEQLGAKNETFVSSLSYDGKRLYLTRYDISGSDIYISFLKDTIWSKMQKLNSNINTKDWDSHASENEDGSMLYFASNRPGGEGAMDIYYSIKDTKGNWKKAINIGKSINTRFNEDMPSISNGGYSLFFCSQGYSKNLNYEILYSNKLDSTQWSTPVNVGYPINTEDDDMVYLPLSKETKTFYNKIATQSDYAFQNMNKKSITIKGKINFNADILNPPKTLKAYLINNIKGDSIELAVDSLSLTYSTIIKAGLYTVVSFAEGFIPKSDGITIPIILNNDVILLNPTFSKADNLPALKENSRINNDKYTIQVSANKNEIDFIKLKKHGFVKISDGADGFSRITIGEFDTKEQAMEMLTKIKESGFERSYIRRISTISNY